MASYQAPPWHLQLSSTLPCRAWMPPLHSPLFSATSVARFSLPVLCATHITLSTDTRLEEGGVPQVPREVWGHRRPHQRRLRPYSPLCLVSPEARPLLPLAGLVVLTAANSMVVLVRLYEEPEKPGNALDFIKQYLGASVGVDVEGLRAVIATLHLCLARCPCTQPCVLLKHGVPPPDPKLVQARGVGG
jgi:hypothetical protein